MQMQLPKKLQQKEQGVKHKVQAADVWLLLEPYASKGCRSAGASSRLQQPKPELYVWQRHDSKCEG